MFEEIVDNLIMQGDILFNIPIFNFSELVQDYKITETGEIAYDIKYPEEQPLIKIGVILNNTCDIFRDKTNRIYIAPIELFDDYSERTKKNGVSLNRRLTDLENGVAPSKYIMKPCDIPKYNGVRFVVDFHQVFIITKHYVYKVIEKTNDKRYRLESPYREHLAYSFAHYFGRVALP